MASMFHMKGMTNRRTLNVALSSASLSLFAVTVTLLLDVTLVSCHLKGSMSCSAIGSSCPAYLYYTLNDSDTLPYLASLFSVPQNKIMQEDTNWNTGGVIVSVQCLCSDNLTFQAEAAYRVNPGDTPAAIVAGTYEYLTLISTQNLVAGELLEISLHCGCVASLGQPLLTYVVQSADTLERLAIRFNTSTTTIMKINNMTEQDYLTTDMAYYIPIHDSALKPVSALPFVSSADLAGGNGDIALGAIVGIVLAVLLLIAAVATLVFFLQTRKICCYKINKPPGDDRSPGSSDLRASADSSTSKRQSWDVFGSLLQCDPLSPVNRRLNVKHSISSSLSKDTIMSGVFGLEKPLVFGYDEIVAATADFKESNMIGTGAYGAVYFGLLRDQEVAIKKMKATNTKEFLAELKVVCKVHHTNLVELIGYAFREFDLFLVYEYAENRAVSDRLHNPHLKGFTPLTWNARVQIALDAGRGLEYIHEQTEARYVHNDVTTSNILLDGYFRAKVADFGLAKLAEQSKEGAVIAARTNGSLGYLAPECVRDGQATAKSDVYAFGVVLFELITGEAATIRSTTSGIARRSIITTMLVALDDPSCNRAKLKAIIDPLLQDTYSFDSVLKMSILGQQCVEEDPHDRPCMKGIVWTLSQIMVACIEWEGIRAENNQVSSGLKQGR